MKCVEADTVLPGFIVGYSHDVGSEMPIILLSADPLQLRVGDYVELH
jgi:hypothetical protein